MQFGRDVSPDEVCDWALPVDGPVEESRSLQSITGGPSGTGRLLLGAPGWSSVSLAEELAGHRVPPSERLGLYASHCAAVELNATFYGVSAERCRSWRDQVPEDFRFVAKLPRLVSHARGGPAAGQVLEEAMTGLHELGDRLAACFLQLPESRGPRLLPGLVDWLDCYENVSPVPLAVELRHPGWFTAAGRTALDAVCSRLAVLGACLLLTDTAGRRDVLHMRRTTDWIMVRWVGNAGHRSDRQRLEEWAQRLSAWRREGLSWTGFFLHQKDEAHCVAGIRQLAGDPSLARWNPAARLWNEAAPASMAAPQSGQQSLF